MHRLATATALVLLLSGCSASATGTAPAEECDRPRAYLDVGGRSVVVPVSGDRSRRVDARVGDVLRFRATGNCRASVSADPQNGRLRVVWPHTSTPGRRTFEAVRPGRERLTVTTATCASPPNTSAHGCFGGVELLGTVFLQVRK